MIVDFGCKETKSLWEGVASRRFPPDAQARALRKLRMLDAAQKIEDLRHPPGNRLEALAGNRKGQWSIRVTQQWRLCFRWEAGDAYEVELVDYH